MREDREDKHYTPEMPPVSAQYLIDFFFEVGPVIATDMGQRRLDHVALRAWQEDTGVVLRPWESRFIVSLSSEWIDAAREGEDPFSDPPWTEAPYVRPKPERLIAKIKAAL